MTDTVDVVAQAIYSGVRKAVFGMPKWESADLHVHSAFHYAAGQAINTYENTKKEETAMTDSTREVVELIEYGTKQYFEVEEYITTTRAWRPLLNRVQTTQQYDTHHEAGEAAEEHSKLYHRDTRVVKVTP